MRVGVDGRSLVAEGGRGVARYLQCLLTALAGLDPDDRWEVLLPRRGRLQGGLVRPNVGLHRLPAPARPLHAAAAVTGRPRLDRIVGRPLDVFWAPAPAPMALSAGLPLALTIHDLSFDERPGDFTAYERLWHGVARPRALAVRATRVLAVSAATRATALERWQLDPARVAVVRPGVRRPDGQVSDEDVEAVRRRHGLAPRFFLIAGALEPRKAPDVVARGFAAARAAGLDADLAVVGAGRSASVLDAPGVRRLGHVGDDDLDALYAGALALVMPSRLEGFGFPPLEALAHGTPSVISDLAVFRETLGDGALRVPVDDADALARALIALAADAGLRARLVISGRDHSAHMTWDRAAREARAALVAAADDGSG